jgi:hypothetical protein
LSAIDVFNGVGVFGAGTTFSAPISLGEKPHDVLWICQVNGNLGGTFGVQITSHSKDDVAWDEGAKIYKANATALWVPYTSFSPTATLSLVAPGTPQDYIDAQELNGRFARLSFTWTAGMGSIYAFPTSKRW